MPELQLRSPAYQNQEVHHKTYLNSADSGLECKERKRNLSMVYWSVDSECITSYNPMPGMDSQEVFRKLWDYL